MAYGDNFGEDITLPASADFSDYQYHFVTVDANGRGTICTAATDKVLGVLQNKPSAAEQPMRIRTGGISKLVFGAASNEADWVTTNAQGFGTAAAGTSIGVCVGGVTLASVGGSGDIGSILISRFVI